MKQTLIFDFDGVIADSFHVVVSALNQSAEQFGFRTLNSADLLTIRNLNSRKILQYLGISLLKFPTVLAKIRRDLHEQMESIPLCAGIKEILHDLHHQGCRLGILTSNAVPNIERYLAHHQISEFDFIYGGSSLFGKARLLRKIMKSHNMSPQQAYYIGDETRDIEAAKACNVRSVAVSWGFNSPEILVEYVPDYIIFHPNDLLNFIWWKNQKTLT